MADNEPKMNLEDIKTLEIKKFLLFFSNFGYVSVVLAVLYFLGYVWKNAYYDRLQIPSSLREYPFPELLVPQSSTLFFYFLFLFPPILFSIFIDFLLRNTDKSFLNESFSDIFIESINSKSIKKLIMRISLKSSTVYVVSIVALISQYLWMRQWYMIVVLGIAIILSNLVKKTYESKSRLFFYFVLFVSLIIGVGVQDVDGSEKAKRDLIGGKFPVANCRLKNMQDKGDAIEGLFLGEFKDQVIFLNLKKDDLGYKYTLVNKSDIASLDFRPISLIEHQKKESVQKLTEAEKKLSKATENLQDIKKTLIDPNAR